MPKKQSLPAHTGARAGEQAVKQAVACAMTDVAAFQSWWPETGAVPQIWAHLFHFLPRPLQINGAWTAAVDSEDPRLNEAKSSTAAPATYQP